MMLNKLDQWLLITFLVIVLLALLSSCKNIEYETTKWEPHNTLDSMLVSYSHYSDGTTSRWEKAIAHGDTLFVGIYYVPAKYKEQFKVVIETDSFNIMDWYVDPTHPMYPAMNQHIFLFD